MDASLKLKRLLFTVVVVVVVGGSQQLLSASEPSSSNQTVDRVQMSSQLRRCRPLQQTAQQTHFEHDRPALKPADWSRDALQAPACRCLATKTSAPREPQAQIAPVNYDMPTAACETVCSESCCATGRTSELQMLIHRSQTAASSVERRAAIHELSDHYDCRCHPEVMDALLFALHDCDERVRSKAADEIGDQLRNSPACCHDRVLMELQQALCDCDRFVRRQAVEALGAVGYNVVDGKCYPWKTSAADACDGCEIVSIRNAAASELVLNEAATEPFSELITDSPAPPPTDAVHSISWNHHAVIDAPVPPLPASTAAKQASQPSRKPLDQFTDQRPVRDSLSSLFRWSR